MSLFFLPRHKAQKDRSILKRIDQTLSRQGLPSALLHFGLFIILEWYLMGDTETPKPVYMFGLALVVMAAWRFIMIAQFEGWYAKGPARWRDVFILSGFFHAGIWSGYLAYRMATTPENPIFMLGILYTAAIAAGGTFVYSLYGKTVRLYLFILLSPLAIYFYGWSDASVDKILAVGIVAMYVYLVSTAHRVSDLVWSFLAANHEYKLRLSALEQAREATTVESKSNRRFIQQILLRVKNPLSGLLGVLGMLSVDENDHQHQGMLNIARRSGYSILDLINDLEAFIEQRDQTRVPQSMVFNLRKTLEHALADMGARAHENGRELSYLYHPDVPERVEADPQWLSNAFRRLLDFTLDMAQEGEITARIAFAEPEGHSCLQMTFYFINDEITEADLTSALERHMDVLPEDEDVADQLTLMVAAAQFKAMGAELSASGENGLKKIFVNLPITVTTQQASSFKPAKYMAGRSILLVDLSPQNERSLTAEFMGWNMNVAVWTMERLVEDTDDIDTDFIFINVPVDDQRAREMLKNIQVISSRFSDQTHVVLYASELQRNLFGHAESNYTFVEKPVARDQLLSALREAKDQAEIRVKDTYRCEDTKILIAEDNLLNQKVVLRLLEQTGVQADTCVNGTEAIDAIQNGDYKLVLMDCFMPRVDGMEATREIRKGEADTGKHIPIVAMTSEQTPELERECLAAGMDDFLSKPLQREALVELLQRWTA